MVKQVVACVALVVLSYAAHAQSGSEYTEWVKKANAFYDAKQYKQSAAAFSHAFASQGWTGTMNDRYSAACSWAMAGVKDSAFFQLNRIATKANYIDLNHLVVDTDLESLHKDKRWKDLCDIVKRNKEKAEANLNKPLVAILDTVMQNDQKYRMQLGEVEKKYGQQSKEMTALWKTIKWQDSVDLVKVTSILDKYGWAGPDVVGQSGNLALFIVIQHSDIKVQDKYLPMMREAVKNHNAQPSALALLEDRVALAHGKKQLYGSQIHSDDKGQFLAPLEDPDNVDKRRAEVGLGPIAEYLQNFQLTWNLEEFKKQQSAREQRQNSQGNK